MKKIINFEDLRMTYDDFLERWQTLKNNLGVSSKDVKVICYKVEFLDKNGWRTKYEMDEGNNGKNTANK